jgi:hypothetical protein
VKKDGPECRHRDLRLPDDHPEPARGNDQSRADACAAHVETDPIEVGLVTSLSRPGGNLTGVANLNVGLGAQAVGTAVCCEIADDTSHLEEPTVRRRHRNASSSCAAPRRTVWVIAPEITLLSPTWPKSGKRSVARSRNGTSRSSSGATSSLSMSQAGHARSRFRRVLPGCRSPPRASTRVTRDRV